MPEFNWTPELPSVPPLGGRQKRAPLSLASDPPIDTPNDEPQFTWKPEPLVKPAAAAPTGDVYDVNPNRIRSIPKRDTPWSINDFDQIGSWYRQTYGKAIPTRAFGQGNIHNSQGWDHRNAVDLGMNPNTPEGQAVVQYLKENNIPFQAFNRAVKNPTTGRVSSTGPHIHVGEPSHSTTQQYTPGTRMARTNDVPGAPVTPTNPTNVVDNAPEFNWTPEPVPVPEAPATLAAQVNSAARPDSPKLGVLITPGERPRKIPTGFKRVETPKGNLYYDAAKVKAAGITDPVAEMDRILGTVEPVGDTSQGDAVVARDPVTGQELEAKIATTPATQQTQARVNARMHPGSVQTVEPAQSVVARRQVPIRRAQPGGNFMERAGQVMRRYERPEADIRRMPGGSVRSVARRAQREKIPVGLPTNLADVRARDDYVLSNQPSAGLETARLGAEPGIDTPSPGTMRTGTIAQPELERTMQGEQESAQAEHRRVMASLTPQEQAGIDADVQNLLKSGRISAGGKMGLSGSIARTDLTAAGIADAASNLLARFMSPQASEVDAGADMRRQGMIRQEVLRRAAEKMPASRLRDVVEFAAAMPLDLARLGALSKLPGGAITGFAADAAAQEYGQSRSATRALPAAAKGAATGAIFHATSGAPLVSRAIATGLGTGSLDLATGATPEDALKGGLLNAAFTAMPHGKPEAEARQGAIEATPERQSPVIGPVDRQPLEPLRPRSQQAASVHQPESPDFTDKVLAAVPVKGMPGLSSRPREYTAGAISTPGHEIVYRDPQGRVVAVARVAEVDGQPKVVDFATDKSRGLLAGRAAVRVGVELKRLGITEPAGTMSPEAEQFRTKGLAKPAVPPVAPKSAPERPVTAPAREVAPTPAPQPVEAARPKGTAPVATPERGGRQPWEMTREAFTNAPNDEMVWVFRGEHPTERHGGESSDLYVASLPKHAANYSGPRGERGELYAIQVPRSALRPSPEIARRGITDANEALSLDDAVVAPDSIIQRVKLRDPNRFDDELADPHKLLVEAALDQGKPVPPEVLADYPDLAKASAKPAPERVAPVAPAKAAAPVRKSRAKPVSEMTLSEFVRSQGGIRLDVDSANAGEFRRISNKETGTTGLINQHSSHSAEDMGRLAHDAGFLRGSDAVTDAEYGHVDPNQFLEMVEQDQSGHRRIYHPDREISDAELYGLPPATHGQVTKELAFLNDREVINELGSIERGQESEEGHDILYRRGAAHGIPEEAVRAHIEHAQEQGPYGELSAEGSRAAHAEEQVEPLRPRSQPKPVEPPKLPPLKPTEPVSENRGTSKIGKSIEAKAIEAGITRGFSGTAEFDKTTVKEQAAKIADLISKEPERVHRIISGEEPLPAGVNDSFFIKGVEDWAQAHKDVDTLMKIAQSPLTSETSAHAQSLRFARERSPDSAALRIKELRDARRQAVQDRLVNEKVEARVKEEVAKIKTTTRRQTTNKQNWSKFISEIAC